MQGCSMKQGTVSPRYLKGVAVSPTISDCESWDNTASCSQDVVEGGYGINAPWIEVASCGLTLTLTETMSMSPEGKRMQFLVFLNDTVCFHVLDTVGQNPSPGTQQYDPCCVGLPVTLRKISIRPLSPVKGERLMACHQAQCEIGQLVEKKTYILCKDH